ncbi:endospore germination permease [Bacillus sp. CECT 9360]|uniref:GerAB/ArcD/ProY family transporter n=1 Tax=Bacillus sp. CECT 9360 TaxID=2845821 RepID=UPI001E57538F|nr:endospore germination permease [Bacillus sp. CECT 9360]CAH0347245.1 Spore germination protein YndE [Bacillus sp. CECT 9360]
MGKEKISYFQFFCLIVLFEIGSAVMFSTAAKAKQDAWLVILIAMVLGILLFWMYMLIRLAFPKLPLTGYVQLVFGKFLGRLIGFAYVIYFMYITTRLLRDFEELLMNTVYEENTIFSIGVTMMVALIYANLKGIEVFSRTTELGLFFILSSLLIIIALHFAGGDIQVGNLQPMLENGWDPVLKEVFPGTLTVTFGELIVFTMLMPHVRDKKLIKTGMIAVLVSGLLLALITAITISVITPSVRLRATFPILTAASYINIGFIQRLETVVIIVLVILVFIKISIFFFCAVKGTADLFKIKEPNSLVFPIGVIILLSSIMIAPNYNMHIQEGLSYVPYYLHIPLQIIIPVIIFIVVLIKKRKKQSRRADE